MKIFFITSILALSILNASNIDISNREQELRNKITQALAEQTTLRANLHRKRAQISRLKEILEKKGDIMLGAELCSVSIEKVQEEQDRINEDFTVLYSIFMDLKEEYESLTGSLFSLQPYTALTPDAAPSSTFKSPHRLDTFKVTSAGLHKTIARLEEDLQKDPSQDSLDLITLLPVHKDISAIFP